jgi:hypothetical protein
MNNTNNEIKSKVVYINEEDVKTNVNDATNTLEQQATGGLSDTAVSLEDTVVNLDTEFGKYKGDDDYNHDDEIEEDYTSTNNEMLLNLKESGYESDGGNYLSDSDSIATDDILRVDPLYMRLTKFLESDDGESVANTLKKINEQLVNLNTNLSKNH